MGAGDVIRTNGSITIKPTTANETIGISGGGTLDISNTVLGVLSPDQDGNGTGSLIIGDATAGVGTVDIDTWDITNKTYDVEIHGGTLDFAAGDIVWNGSNSLLLDARAADITLPENYTKSASDASGSSTITFKSSGSVIDTGGYDLTTSTDPLNVTLWADSDNNSDGYIDIDNATITTKGGNVIMGGGTNPINDFAHGNGGHAIGLRFQNGAINTGVGNITMNGFGGPVAGQSGVATTNADIDTTSGNITINGTGNTVGISGNSGAYLLTSTFDTGAGAISITGTAQSPGDNTVNDYDRGLNINTSSVRTSSAVDGEGNITLIGRAVASTAGQPRGVELVSGAQVQTNAGDIAITGEGNALAFITWQTVGITSTGGGDITIDTSSATEASVFGVSSPGGGTTFTLGGAGAGDITITANSVTLSPNHATTDIRGRSITIKPDSDAATTIGLGTGAGTLNLDNLELGYMTADAFTFGSSTSGDLQINTTKDFGDANLSLISGGNVNIAGTITRTTSGADAINNDVEADYLFKAGGNVSNSNNSDIISTGGEIDVTLWADSDSGGDGYILLSASTVTTQGGDFIAGGGANPATSPATGPDEYGVRIGDSDITTGSGNISLRGHTTGTTDQKHGVILYGAPAKDVLNTTSGTITITGTTDATTGGSYGIFLDGSSNGSVTRTTSGNITLHGTGSANATTLGHGVRIKDNADIFSTTGDITITAIKGGGGSAVEVSTSGAGLNTIGGPTHTGDITFILDDYTLNNITDIQTTGTVTIKERTPGRSIGIGTGAGQLAISDAELGQLAIGSLVIGGNTGGVGTSGDMQINSAHTFAQDTTLFAGGNVDLQSNIGAAAGKTLRLDAGTGSITGNGNTVTATNLYLDADTTIVADVTANYVDIGTNSNGATLTGILTTGAKDQAAANQIQGGPGNNGDYTFEGFIIRLFGGNTIPLPTADNEITPVIPEEPTTPTTPETPTTTPEPGGGGVNLDPNPPTSPGEAQDFINLLETAKIQVEGSTKSPKDSQSTIAHSGADGLLGSFTDGLITLKEQLLQQLGCGSASNDESCARLLR